MEEKLNFFEWADANERQPHETPSTVFIENYARNSVWKSYRTGQPVHDGDCTNCPYTCDLCVLTDLLVEYREYYFDTSDKKDGLKTHLVG